MKNFIVIIILLFGSSKTFSNSFLKDTIQVNKQKVDLSGFLRVDYWYDSRQNTDAVDGLFLLYPKDPNLDENGQDINQSPSLNSLAVATRLRSTITMPDLFKAKSLIYLEVDFTGLSSIVHVRLRHAYSKLKWDKYSVLAGLTWHPLFANDVFPTVASLNTGAPFQSFNRSPQLTASYTPSPNFMWSLSAVYQSDSRSPGPSDYSSSYLKNAVIPNLNTLVQFGISKFTVGFSFDYKALKPRLFTNSIISPAKKYLAEEKIHTYSGMAYLKYKKDDLTIKLKGMYGQNLAEHLMLGGYAVSKLDSLTGAEKYTPYNHLFTFANITYGKKYQIGLFAGYAKNLGTSENIVSKTDRIFARGANIGKIIRVSPSLSYVSEKFMFSLEFESTNAFYGDIIINDKARIANQTKVVNNRVLCVIQYSF